MIEKWLKNEIENKFLNSNRILLYDEMRQWEFLVDAACADYCLVKRSPIERAWERKQEELFLRYKIEKDYADDNVVIYVQGELANDSFLIDYARTGGCIELTPEWIRETILKMTSLQVSLTDDELYTACHIGVGKDTNWWKRIIQKIEDVLSLEDDILQFLDDPDGFISLQSPAVKKLYIQEFCKLLNQPEQDKPFATFAKEISKHIFEGLISGKISNREYSIYCKWVDSHEHNEAFKRYLNDFKVPEVFELNNVSENHCFLEIDKKYLELIVSNLYDQKQLSTLLKKINKRIKFMKSNPYIAKWWPDVVALINYKDTCPNTNIVEISNYYVTKFSSVDRSMRRILSYLKSYDDIIRPLQEYYERLNSDLLNTWFLHTNEYKSNQTGFLTNLIKKSNVRIAIIVGDGVRYEVADSVVSCLSSAIKTKKEIMYAGLPSETENNMSALYSQSNVIVPDKSSREKLLTNNTEKQITYMQLEDVNETTDGDILVLTYKDIDDAGEKMQQSMLRLIDDFEELLVEKIQMLLHAGYKEVHLVTDHGFVLTGILDESDKIPTDDIIGQKKVSERFIRTVQKQEIDKYISFDLQYGEYNYVNFSKSTRPFSSTGKYGYSHGGFTPQEVIIPNFTFTYDKTNQLAVGIKNKTNLLDTTGDIVTIKISSGEKAIDLMSCQRRIRIVLYSSGKEIDKSGILTIGLGTEINVELSLNGVNEALAVVVDEDSKDQLDKAEIKKTNMRDLGGLL